MDDPHLDRTRMTRPHDRNRSERLNLSDIRGLAQLATQATAGTTRIVEGVHQSVRSTLGLRGGDEPGRTAGISGLVYRAIHGVTRRVGQGVDAALAGLQPLVKTTETAGAETPRRATVLAALNGVMGDQLVASDNPFATPMTLRCRDEVWSGGTPPPRPEATGKILLLVHGLCMSELQWRAAGQGDVVDHGETLADALGYTPVHLRYNSGLHTSVNGRELSARLERLLADWPTPVEELSVLAHSMGGLLIRSAAHYGRQDSSNWPGHLQKIVFLGTPHHGAPLERLGNWVDRILHGTPYTAPFARIGRLRSAGITDLRYGHLLDDDWQGRDRFERSPDHRTLVPLPEGVNCFVVAAGTANQRGMLADRLIGDGLVPLRSALGEHDDPRRDLAFPRDSRMIAFGTNHIGLLSSRDVTRQLVRWLTPG